MTVPTSLPRAGVPRTAPSCLSAEADALLARLDHPGARVRKVGDMAVVERRRGTVSLGAGRFSASALEELLAAGRLERISGTPAHRRAAPTMNDPARAPDPAPDRGPPEARAHRRLEQVSLPCPDLVAEGRKGAAAVLVNVAESPLAWLARRSGRDGAPFLPPHAVMAGERLRNDVTIAGMMPRLSLDWSKFGTARADGGPGDRLSASDALVAARQRVSAAMAAIGPELAGVLIDLCAFLKGIETIERERGWPVRSGKVVVRLALLALARHYGLSEKAVGAPRRTIRGMRLP